MAIGILVLLIIALLAIVAVGTLEEDAKTIAIAGSVIAFIFVGVYIAAFILSVSILF